MLSVSLASVKTSGTSVKLIIDKLKHTKNLSYWWFKQAGMYLAVTNRKPNSEWLKQARGLFSRWNKKNLGLGGRGPKNYSGASGSQTSLPPTLAVPAGGCGLIGAVWLGLYLEMSLWSLQGNGQRTKMVFYSRLCDKSLSWNFHLYFFGHSLLQGFWETRRLHFQLLVEGGKEEGNQDGSRDPTRSFPTRGKLRSLWQKHQVVLM